MDDSLKQNELSDEDLAILQAFDAMDIANWEQADVSPATPADEPAPVLAEQEILSPDDMLALFVAEVNEDLTAMIRALHKRDAQEHRDGSSLQVLQRAAHKVKGTAGAVGCGVMASIALHIEELIGFVADGSLAPASALHALARAVHALELTLKSLVTYGQESATPLNELEEEFKALQLEMPCAQTSSVDEPVRIAFKALEEEEEEGSSVTGGLKNLQEHPAAAPIARIDVRRLERLALHSQHLAELSAPLQNAQAEVEKALQDLQSAQARLRQLEASLSTTIATQIVANRESGKGDDERPTSSLVARILRESIQHNGSYSRKSRQTTRPLPASQSWQWDALEMDHYTANDVLLHAFNEAIDDVATASAQLRLAIDKLHRLTSQHVDQAHNVRNDTLLLRLNPVSTLLTRIERAISMSASAQRREIQFVVEGETTEIDQDVLEELKRPLLQLVRTCLASRFETAHTVEESAAVVDRAWFYVRPVGNEVTIELGFSLAVGGGAIEEMQAALRSLHGSMTVDRNVEGGISFHMRVPRSQGAVQSLLVRVGNYQLLVPFSQIQRIDYGLRQAEPPAPALGGLLGWGEDQGTKGDVPRVLVLQPGSLQAMIQVDEVLGNVELVVKPLAAHIRRPGIAGAAVDGMGNVLLLVDVFELLRFYERHQRVRQRDVPAREGGAADFEQAQPTVLIADDSVYIRRSLQQTLQPAGYRVMEARDGMEALELLLTSRPSHPHAPVTAPVALVLDLEMPNLNGYDLLSMLRVHPELAALKIVMLTSRSSEKHKERAYELGAHAYLTKPCTPETLRETLQSLLKD